jgi:Tfp pilus assembly protein PilF
MAALARYYLATDDATLAVEWAEKAVRRRRRRASYQVLLAEAFTASGDASGARQAYRRALELDPNNRAAQGHASGD